MYAALRRLTEKPTGFLREKKLEFLRNAVLGLDREIPDDDFFQDLADQIEGPEQARKLCAPAFAADGMDEMGRPLDRAPSEAPGGKEPPRASLVQGGDDDDDDGDENDDPEMDLDELFHGDDDLDDGPPPFSRKARADAAKFGPFRPGRPVAAALRDIWRETDGLNGLRKNLAALVGRRLEAVRRDHPRRDPFKARVAELRRFLHLTAAETDLLVFLHIFYEGRCDWFRGLAPDPFPGSRIKPALHRLFGIVIGVPGEVVAEALSPDGALLRYGVVFEDDYAVSRTATRHLSGLTKGDLRSSFYAPAACELLPWDYFPEELRRHGETIAKLVRADRGERGLDVLLHGVAGAGKTSFARALAERLGMRAVAVAMDSEGPAATDRKARRDFRVGGGEQAAFRLGALAIAERECDPAHDILVVDEADTMLGRACGNRLNDLLDRGRCVRFWLGNLEPGEELPESNLRRFDYAVRFEPLGARERTAVWRNCAAKAGLEGILEEEDLADFAERYPVSAGIVARVCRNVACTGLLALEGRESVRAFAETLLESHAKLLGVRARPAAEPKRVSAGYVLDGLAIRGDVPLPDVLAAAKEHLRRLAEDDKGDGAARRDPPRLNVLLSGPPGCGKTEFVKWLGEQLGRKVVALGASDLKDKYVGETEKRIARAFKDAERDGAVLFFDEVDSFLRSRAGAVQSWEVSQTNELLARLEDFRGLFVAATNFPSSLDPAVLRRFTFKLSFGYLANEGKRLFFERFFGDPLTEAERAELDAIPDLCPGDFRTVRQRLDYLPGGKTNARRLAALREESDRKASLPRGDDEFGERTRGRLGFGA